MTTMVSCETQSIINTQNYYGEVTFEGDNDEKLIFINGLNITVWLKNNEINLGDVVHLKTVKNDFTNLAVDSVLCTKKYGHCHFKAPLHNKFHIRPRSLSSSPSDSVAMPQQTINYGGEDYKLVDYYDNESATLKKNSAWIRKDIIIPEEGVYLYILWLNDKNREERKLNNFSLIIDPRTEEHTHD